MRRSASEIISDLEMRIARLERQAASSIYQKKLESFESQLKKDVKSLVEKYDKLDNPDDELIQLFNGFARTYGSNKGGFSYDLNALIGKLESVMEAMDEASDKLSK
jgi:biopolymer transport protein ExbB/TolQ